MPVVAPYQPEGLEMKPLNHRVMVAMCLASAVPECGARPEEDGKERAEPPSAQHPCCREAMNRLSGDYADGKAFRERISAGFEAGNILWDSCGALNLLRRKW